MNDNAMIVIRAFRGLDKEAGCDTADKKPIGRATAIKYGWKDPKSKRTKKAVITKESLSKNVIDDGGVIDVAVERINKSAKLAALEALDAMKKAPDQQRPSGVTNAKVSEVGMLRSKARDEKKKQEQISAMGDSLGPKIAMAMAKRAAGGAAAQADPYAAFEQMQRDGATVSKAIPGLDPNVVLQGQHQGIDMTPSGIKKRLGAHEMISKGKKILADENKNGVPDIAEGSAGAGMGEQALAGGQPQAQPQMPKDPAQMIAAAKLRMPDLTKAAAGIVADAPTLPSYTGAPDLSKFPFALSEQPRRGRSLLDILAALPKTKMGPGRFRFNRPIRLSFPTAEAKAKFLSRGKAASVTAQNTKDDDEGDETKPGILRLELASDQPAKKAPEKKPEAASENEAEIKGKDKSEKKANMGGGASPLAVSSGLPRREGFKTTNRQDVFDDLGKWSLGKDL